MTLQAPPRIQGESSQERKWKEEVTRLANLSGAGSSVVDAKYVVTELDASLTNEKLLAPSTDIEVITDASSVSLELKETGVTAGAYTSVDVTVDSKGRILSISSNTSSLYKGALSSPPSSPSDGWMYYNTSNGNLYVYSSGVWNAISGGGAVTTNSLLFEDGFRLLLEDGNSLGLEA